MKNYFLTMLAIVMGIMISCKQPTEEATTEDATTEDVSANMDMPDYDTFDRKLGVIRALLQAHSDEDLAAQAKLISDTVKWSPPQYNGNKWLGKQDILAALKKYHDDFDNIKFTEGIVLADSVVGGVYSGSVFPKSDATNSPNAIRVYGTWTATHTATKKEVGVKWYAIGWVDDSNQVVMWTEYFDANGISAQLAE
jgi:hypothetical protein